MDNRKTWVTYDLPQQITDAVNKFANDLSEFCASAGVPVPILDNLWLWCFPGVEKACIQLEPKAEKELKREKGEDFSCDVVRFSADPVCRVTFYVHVKRKDHELADKVLSDYIDQNVTGGVIDPTGVERASGEGS